MRIVLAIVCAAGCLSVAMSTNVAAQATCRQKCVDEEQACLNRTFNKGQCGERAKICLSRCK